MLTFQLSFKKRIKKPIVEMVGKKHILSKWKWRVRNAFPPDEITHIEAQSKNYCVQSSSHKFRWTKEGSYWMQL